MGWVKITVISKKTVAINKNNCISFVIDKFYLHLMPLFNHVHFKYRSITKTKKQWQ